MGKKGTSSLTRLDGIRIMAGGFGLAMVHHLGPYHPASAAFAATYAIGVLVSLVWEHLKGD